MTAPHDILFPHDPDPLARYRREDADRKAAAESERHQATESRQVTALRAEIAELRAGLAERDQKFLDIVDQLATGLNKVEAWVHKAIEARVTRSEADICIKISERFGELRGWISAIDPTQARAKSGEPFKFANERDRDDDVPELPNFLPARAIN